MTDPAQLMRPTFTMDDANDPRDAWIRRAADVCKAAAEGDLEARILHIDVDGDLGTLLHGINHLLDMTDAFVREATASMDYAGRDKYFRRVLRRGMLGVFRQAADKINNTTHAMEERTLALREAEKRRAELEGEFTSTKQVVEQLASASQAIKGVAKIIGTVTRQTNLISLNAAIEAARVGDAGRGFAVVAREVKALADRTADATKEIQSNVDAINLTSTQAVDAIDRIWQVVKATSANSK